MSTYQQDRVVAKYAELDVCYVLNHNGFRPKLNPTPDGFEHLEALQAYDLSFQTINGTILAEVKEDRLSHKTGNIALEHRSLTHSKADYLFLVRKVIEFAPMPEVLRMMKDPKYRVTQAGEQWDNKATLVPIEDWIAEAKGLTLLK